MRLPLSILDKSLCWKLLDYHVYVQAVHFCDDRIQNVKSDFRIFLGAYECVAENDKGVGVSEPVKIQVLCK